MFINIVNEYLQKNLFQKKVVFFFLLKPDELIESIREKQMYIKP